MPRARPDFDPFSRANVAVRDVARNPILTAAASQSNLNRSAYCVLGMPIDAVSVESVLKRIETAATHREALLISTPNLNFLVGSLSDPEFRETLLDSDLCSADGAPVVWIARLLGLPIKERVAGSDLVDRLQAPGQQAQTIKVFLFGGAKGVAAAAGKSINAKTGGLYCVGVMDPGFCDVGEMSHNHVIDAINSSGADLLSVSLGAKKGQLWLHRNHSRLTIPVRAHLGAAINFQAGIIRRAPPIIRAMGFEWLWRIKEEHHLWKRYLNDGLVLLRLLLTRVVPLAVTTRWQKFSQSRQRQDLLIVRSQDDRRIVISLRGAASERHIQRAIACFQNAICANQDLVLDLSETSLIDPRFFGLLLMLRKELKSRGAKLIFTGVSRKIERIFRLSELQFLLAPTPPR